MEKNWKRAMGRHGHFKSHLDNKSRSKHKTDLRAYTRCRAAYEISFSRLYTLRSNIFNANFTFFSQNQKKGHQRHHFCSLYSIIALILCFLFQSVKFARHQKSDRSLWIGLNVQPMWCEIHRNKKLKFKAKREKENKNGDKYQNTHARQMQ